VPNLLLIGGSRDRSTRFCAALRARGVEPAGASRWVETPAACRAALAEGEWDAAICFAEGASLAPAVAPLLADTERPPLVVVTETPSEALSAEALRHGASIGAMPGDGELLAEAIRRAAHDAGARRRRRHAALFDEGQRHVLERIAQGAPLPEVLELIVRLVEGREEDLACSLILVDEEAQTIHFGAAPHLPEAYNRAIDGLRIGPEAGSCGAAAFRGQEVIVEDIATHPNWAPYRHLALPHGLRACWSTPVFSPEGAVLGTFAMYHRSPHRPTDQEREWVAMATRLASIAILRDRDVSAVKQSEDRFRSEARLRQMIYDAVSDVIFYIAVEAEDRYRFVLVNPAFLKATGLAEEQVVGKLTAEVVPPSSLAAVHERYRLAIRERRTVRWEEISPYPSGTKHGDVAVTPLFDAAGVCTNLVGTVHDVTERREAEARIAGQAALLDRAKDAIILRGIDDVVRFWNAGAERLYGWTRAEAVGRSIVELLYRDTRAYAEARRQVAERGEWSGEIKQWTKSGRELIAECSWTLMRDAQGRPEAVLAINSDVTERKRLQAEVALAQRMDSLGTLAGGIAHDFNNLLSAIIGHLGLAARELPPDHRTRGRLETVRAAADRATDLVRQILTFSRRQAPQRVPTRLQPIVEEALKLLRSTLPAMIEIRTRLEPEACDVLADPSQIHQVVMNLGTNAAHAMGSHGLLEVRLARVTLSEKLAGIAGEVPPGRYMRLTLTDNGCGMDEATVPRIFDPFFTTKEAGRGTGLGLSVVLGIVKDHGGIIRVTSGRDQGSTFEIHLPEAAAATAPARRAPPLHDLRGRGERVFIVDDEAAVVAFLSETLSGLGYEVSGFTDPREALSAFAAAPAGVDALVSDYAMPGMTGTELARACRRLRPALPIFMTSGYLRPEEAEEARLAGVQAVLQKPDFIEELARVLVEWFARAPGK
jgi:PAS domain S-box-containing protein